MNKAYYWYRPISHFGVFHPGKVLNAISDTYSLSKYLSGLSMIKLARKYFPNGLSPHGLQTLLDYEMKASNVNEPITEIIFELVRQLNFPDAPSRLSSLYASETIPQAKQWQQLWIKNFGDQDGQIGQSLWEIEFETNAQLYDSHLLDIESDDKFSYLLWLENAYRYWQGELTTNPMPELLIPYPVIVTRLIRDTNTE